MTDFKEVPSGFGLGYQTLWNELAVATLTALIPPQIQLPLQRFYGQGVTAGAVKE